MTGSSSNSRTSRSRLNMFDDSMLNVLEGKSQQYTLGFLVGLSGKSSNMTKPADWLQGYCDGLQQRLQGSESNNESASMENTHEDKSAAPPAPLVHTSSFSSFPVQQTVTTPGVPHLAENSRSFPSNWQVPGVAATVYSMTGSHRSSHIPRFPGDGPLARSGPMGQFQLQPKSLAQQPRQTGSGQTLAGYAGNRGVLHGMGATTTGGDRSLENEPTTSSKPLSPGDGNADDIPPKSPNTPVVVTLPPVPTVTPIPNVAATAGSPVRSSKSIAASPKRSPSKRIEQLARHFRSSNMEHHSPPTPNETTHGGERRRWRDGLGRRFSRKDRDDVGMPRSLIQASTSFRSRI
jgi:hypothetical protein